MSGATAQLAARTRYIGGTDIAAIVGVSKWATPLSVYLDKIGEGQKQAETLAMRRGKWMERFISREFVREHPELVVDLHPEPIVRHDWGFPAGASLDGWVRRRRGIVTVAIFEAKTASAFRARDWDEAAGDLPDAYYVQCLWYLAVTDMPLAYAVADVGDAQRVRIVPIERDEETIAALIRAGREFWTGHVEPRIAPLPTGTDRDSQIVAAMYPRSRPDVEIVLPDETAVLASVAAQAAAEEKAAAERKAEAQNRLKAAMGEAEAAMAGTYKLTWKTQTRTTLDSKALRAAHPAIAGEFERTAETRVFRMIERTA